MFQEVSDSLKRLNKNVILVYSPIKEQEKGSERDIEVVNRGAVLFPEEMFLDGEDLVKFRAKMKEKLKW